jgi:hypothetical protein
MLGGFDFGPFEPSTIPLVILVIVVAPLFCLF